MKGKYIEQLRKTESNGSQSIITLVHYKRVCDQFCLQLLKGKSKEKRNTGPSIIKPLRLLPPQPFLVQQSLEQLGSICSEVLQHHPQKASSNHRVQRNKLKHKIITSLNANMQTHKVLFQDYVLYT